MTLNDADADAFFRQGDEGTYSGGPGDSIPTGVVNVFDDLDEEVLPRLTREQIERRDRYTRWVKRFVTTLALGSGLAFGFRAVQGRGDEATLALGAAAQEPLAPIGRHVTDFKPMADAPAAEDPQAPKLAVEPPPHESRPAVAAAEETANPPKTDARESARTGDGRARSVRKGDATAAMRAAETSRPKASALHETARPQVPVHSTPPTAYFPP